MPERGDVKRPGTGRLALVVALLTAGAAVNLLLAARFVSGLEDLRGRRGFLQNDTAGALKHYGRALRWGGAPQKIRTQQAEALLLWLNQSDLGVKKSMPGVADRMAAEARDLVEGLLREEPHRAYFWSLAAELSQRDAREARRRTVLDLSRLSEDPLENLSAAEWLALGLLRTATEVEPNNYLYRDLLAEALLDAGATDAAKPEIRRALRNLPQNAAHQFLERVPMPDGVLDAAVQGYDDALGQTSFVSRLAILQDLSDFLLRNGQFARAVPYLETANREAPGDPNTEYLLGDVLYQMQDYKGAVPHLKAAMEGFPGLAGPAFLLGSAYEGLGELEDAATAYRAARLMEPGETRCFYALGQVLEKLGRSEEATRQFVAATSYHPEDPNTWIALIEYEHRHQDVTGERQACDRLLALRPDDVAAQALCRRADAS